MILVLQILLLKRLIDGSLPFTLNICINIVHIKDVADMHFEAMINDKAPGKRFIASNNHMFFPEIAKVLNDNGFKAPKMKLPSFLARIFSIFDKQVKHFVNDIDILRIYHSKNAKDILRMEVSIFRVCYNRCSYSNQKAIVVLLSDFI